MNTGRNEPCSCGSGKKSKHCCQSAKGSTKAGIAGMIVAALAVIGTAAAIVATRGGEESAAPQSASQPAAPAPGGATDAPAAAPGTPQAAAPAQAALPRTQPPGPAPAGKVWSPEHGHWHEKPQSNEWVTVTPQKTVPLNTSGDGLPVKIPQPAGPAPAGKVWSSEHGHWHDAETGKAVAATVPSEAASQMKQPGLPADLKNYVWSEEHKHWHRKDGSGEHATPTILPPAAPAATATAPANPPR